MKISTLRWAAGLGVAAEAVLWGCFMAYGGIGPCGPNNALSACVMIFHLPGIGLTELLPLCGGILSLPLVLASGAMTFAVLFAIPIALGKWLMGKA